MRVWEKNFLITLSLFVVLFFASVFVVVTTSFSSSLSSERETALREEALLIRALQESVDDIEARKNPSPQAVPSLVASYAPTYARKGIYIQIMQYGNVLYGNLPVDANAAGDDHDTRVCIMLEADGAHYLCINDALSGAASDYPFTYLKDISSLIAAQRK